MTWSWSRDLGGGTRKRRRIKEDERMMLIIVLSLSIQFCSGSRYTLVELRHDCSGAEGEDPVILRDMWTDVVYRLKAPDYQKCHGMLDRPFTWTFDLHDPVECLAMLGCHDLEGYADKDDVDQDQLSFDFNVTVNKHRRGKIRREEDAFQIRHNGVQKFYPLKGNETVQMVFQYHPDAVDRDKEIICFAWCNEQMKRTPPLKAKETKKPDVKPNVDKQLVDSLTDPNRPKISIDSMETAKKNAMSVSPVSVYRLSKPEERCDPQGDTCLITRTFYWHDHNRPCHSNFICTTLEGGVCDTYTVSLTHASNKNKGIGGRTKVCENTQHVKGLIDSTQHALIELEYKRGTFYNADCFFWCTETGDLPDMGKNIDDDLAKKLAEGKWQTQTVYIGENTVHSARTASEDRDSLSISPSAHYVLKQQEEHERIHEDEIDGKMIKTTTFKWSGRNHDSCKGKFICTKLGGNVCGDYGVGIKLDTKGNMTDLCYKNEVVDLSMDLGDSFSVEFWCMAGEHGEDFEDVQCHFWCNQDGDLPRELRSNAQGAELIDYLLSSDASLIRQAEMSSLVPVSPSHIYKFDLDTLHQHECDDGSCVDKTTLAWLRPFECQSSFICPSLPGHVCGDYSISIENDDDVEDVCYESHQYQSDMSTTDRLEITFWHQQWMSSPGANQSLSCYFWCTIDGKLPTRSEEVDGLEELIEAAASGEVRTRERDLEFDEEDAFGRFLSPITFYTANQRGRLSDDWSCEDGVNGCSKTLISTQWRGRGVCHLNVACQKLVGNSCADYAVEISNEEDKIEICHEDETKQLKLQRGDDFALALWRSPNLTEIDLSCSFWCDEVARGGRGRGDLDAEEDMLQSLMNGSRQLSRCDLESPRGTHKSRGASPVKVYFLENPAHIEEHEERCDGEDVCRMEMTFERQQETTGVARFLATKLEGNVCGSFGITIETGDGEAALGSVSEVCHPNRIHNLGSLQSGMTVKITLWWLKGTPVGALSAFFWVTDSGKLPPPSPNPKVNAGIIKLLLDASSSVIPLELSAPSNESSIALSSSKIYRLNLDAETNIKDCELARRGKCRETLDLEMFFAEKCQMGVICPELKGEPCADYQVKIRNQRICHEGELHQLDVPRFGSAKLKTWHLRQRPEFGPAECYAWCTEDGKVPLERKTNPVERVILEKLLKLEEDKMEKVPGPNVGGVTTVTASKKKVYNVTFSSDDAKNVGLSPDEDGVYSYEYHLQWLAPQEAYGGILVTSGLEKDSACALYWFDVQIVNRDGETVQRERICSNGKITRGVLDEDWTVRLTIGWVKEDTDFDLEFFVWTTDDGKLPKKPKSISPFYPDSIENATVSDATFAANEHNLVLSSSIVYKLETTRDDLQCLTKRGKCRASVRLEWLRQERATLKVAMTELEENPGGDFGIIMKDEGRGSRGQELLHTGYVYESPLNQGSIVDLNLWFARKSELRVKGYVWVELGDRSGGVQKIEGADELILKLLNGSHLLENFDLSYLATGVDSHLHASRPTTVFHTTLSSSDVSNCAKRICKRDHAFVNFRKKSCKANVVCSVLEGNVCGDFGIQLDFVNLLNKKGKVSSDVCSKATIHTHDLGPRDRFDMSLWFALGGREESASVPAFDASCYFWCTDDGRLPHPPPDTTPHRETIEKLISGAVHTKPSSPGARQVLSPHKVFVINKTSTPHDCDDRDTCSHTYRYDWRGLDTCQARMLCTQMSDNACGDFGIEMNSTSDAGSRDEVCYPGHLYGRELRPDESLQVELWHTGSSTFSATCFVWCSPEGHLPETPGEVDDDLLRELLAGTTGVEDIDLSEDPVSHAMAPVVVYRFRRNQTEEEDNVICDGKQGRCNSHYQFKWFGRDKCQGTIICNELTNHPCGEYGIALATSDNDSGNSDRQALCRPGVRRTFSLSHLSTLDLTLWWAEEARFTATCYAWCTKHGHLPARPAGSHLTLDDLTDLYGGSRDVRRLDVDEKGVDRFLAPGAVYSIRGIFNDAEDCGSTVCSESLALMWMGRGRGVANFACVSKFGGDPFCGSHGIRVGFNATRARAAAETSHDVCYLDSVFRGSVLPFSRVHLSTWWWEHGNLPESSQCFLWVTTEANRLQADEADRDVDQLILDLTNSSLVMREVEFGDPIMDSDDSDNIIVSETNVSPVFAYKISGEGVDEKDDGDVRGRRGRLELDEDVVVENDADVRPTLAPVRRGTFRHVFKRISGKPCQSHLICPGLEGNACGAFGVSLTYNTVNNNKTIIDVCRPDQVAEMELNRGDSVTLDLWRVRRGALDGVECFFWCTRDGRPPRKNRGNDTAGRDLMDKLLNSKSLVQDLSFDREDETVASPVRVYRISSENASSNCRSDANSKRCVVQAKITWRAPDLEGHWRLVCSRLGGHVCGDYGLGIRQRNKEEISVCRRGKVYSGTFKPGDVLTFGLWWAQGSFAQLAEMRCYFWATEDGRLPRKESEDLVPNMIGSSKRIPLNLLSRDEDAEDEPIAITTVYALETNPDTNERVCDEHGICRLTRRLRYHRREPCQGRLTCTGLRGNPCGEYGLAVAVVDEENAARSASRICHARRIYELGEINRGDSVVVGLWHLQDAQTRVDARCYFWCTPGGQVPTVPEDEGSMLQEEVVDRLLNGSAKLHRNATDLDFDAQPVSPRQIYRVSYHSDQDSKCIRHAGGICRRRFAFQWLRREEAVVSLACTNMEEKPCGDYGVSLSTGDGDAISRELCYPTQVARGEVEEGDVVSVDLWHLAAARINLTCYLWATATGRMPKGRPNGTDVADPDLVEKLFNSSELTHTQPLSSVRTHSNLSPVRLYRFAWKSDGSRCQADRCERSHEFTYHGLRSCNFRMVCSMMTGDPCGNYGLHLKMGKKRSEVCESGILHQSRLNPTQSARIDLWFAKSVRDSEMNCYAWCTIDGSLPVRELDEDDELGGDVIKRVLADSIPVERAENNSAKMRRFVLSPAKIYHICMKGDEYQTDEKITVNHLRFKWLGEESCRSRFICTKMEGNPCGDYGLKVSDNAHSEEICLSGSVFRGRVDPGSSFKAGVWHVPDPDLDLSCYLWCTEDGEPPKGSKDDDGVDDEMVEQLINMTTSVREVDIFQDDLQPPLAISPLRVYHVNGVADGDDCRDDDEDEDESGESRRCWKKRNFVYYADRQCRFGFVCTSLPDNVCGTYGLQLTFDGQDEPIDACRARTIYSGVHYRGEMGAFNLWFTNYLKDKVQAKCYYWCTEDGELPGLPRPTMLNDDILLDLINGSYLTEEVDFSKRRMIPVAPHKIYEIEVDNGIFARNSTTPPRSVGRLSQDEDSNRGDQDGVLRVKKIFTWFGERDCLANLVCSGLRAEEGLWSYFGITVSKRGEESQMVIRDGALYQNLLEEEDELEVSAWMAEAAGDFGPVRCFLWCGSASGRMPEQDVEPHDAEMLDELIEATEDSRPMKFGSDLLAVSPASVYHLEYSSHPNCRAGAEDGDGRCREQVDLTWLWEREQECRSTLVCTQMGGHPCGNYFLEMKYAGNTTAENADEDDLRQEICHSGHEYRGKLEFNKITSLSLRYTKDAKFDVSCHLWCNDRDAEMPKKPLDQDLSVHTTLVALMNGTERTDVVDTENATIGHHTVYRVRLTEDKLQPEKCTEGATCKITKHSRWLGSRLCRANLICPSLSPNICSDHGVEVRFGKRPPREKKEKSGGRRPKIALQSLDLLQTAIAKWKKGLSSSDGAEPALSYHDAEDPSLYYEVAARKKDVKDEEEQEEEKGEEEEDGRRINIPKRIRNHLYYKGLEGETSRVCHQGVLYQGELAPGQELTTTTWYSRTSAEIDIDCYFWCTDDGELPQRHPDRLDAGQHFEEMANATFKVEEIDLSSEPEKKAVVLSTAKMYHIKMDSDDLGDCGGLKCYNDRHFEFYGRSCQASMACDVLSGNPCGDYQITAVFPGAPGATPFCFEEELHRGRLASHAYLSRPGRPVGNVLVLDTWYSPGARFEASCYLWCTSDGELPRQRRRVNDTGVIEKTIIEALSGNVSIHPAVPGTGGHHASRHQAFSPHHVLRIQHNKTSLQRESERRGHGKLRMSYSFESYAEEPCTYAFVCSKLSGNPGGSYWLSLKHEAPEEIPEDSLEEDAAKGKNTPFASYAELHEICFAHEMLTGNASFFSRTVVEIEAVAELLDEDTEIDCFIWCSSDADLPAKGDEGAIKSDEETAEALNELISGSLYHLIDYTGNGQRFFKPTTIIDIKEYQTHNWPGHKTPEEDEKITETQWDGSVVEYSCQEVESGRDDAKRKCLMEKTVTIGLSRVDNCAATVACVARDAGLCANYGVRVQGGDGEAYEDCNLTQLHRFELETCDSLNLTFHQVFKVDPPRSDGHLEPYQYHNHGGYYDYRPLLTCYAWCTPDGKLPPLWEEKEDYRYMAVGHPLSLINIDLEDEAVRSIEDVETTYNVFLEAESESHHPPVEAFEEIVQEEQPEAERLSILPHPRPVFPPPFHNQQEKSWQCERDKCWTDHKLVWRNYNVDCDGQLAFVNAEGPYENDYVPYGFKGPRANQHSWKGNCQDFEVLASVNGNESVTTCGSYSHLVPVSLTFGDSLDLRMWRECGDSDLHGHDLRVRVELTCLRREALRCSCGQQGRVEKSGEEDEGDFVRVPWQVQILRPTEDGHEFACSGALISSGHVVTAAHCFENCPNIDVHGGGNTAKDLTGFKVVLGKARMTDARDNELIADIERLAIHPNYTFNMDDGADSHPRNDMAVVTLSRALEEFSEFAHPVCLPNSGDDEEEDAVMEMTGWGSRMADNECGYAWFDKDEGMWYHTPPRVTREDELESLRIKITSISSSDLIFGRVLQTDSDALDPDPCVGDSGSPLVARSDRRSGRSVLMGLAVSGGDGTCGKDSPVGFVRMSHVSGWVKKEAGIDCE